MSDDEKEEKTDPKGRKPPRPFDPDTQPQMSADSFLMQVVKRMSELHDALIAPEGRLAKLDKRIEAIAMVAEESRAALCDVRSLVMALAIDQDVASKPRSQKPASVAVLVVEDEAMLAKALARLLSADGMFVATAGNASEAKELLNSVAVDVALIDVRLPGSMSGIQLAQWIRDEHGAVRLIIMSGWLDENDVAAATAMGIRVLAKPVGSPELSQAIREALDEASA